MKFTQRLVADADIRKYPVCPAGSSDLILRTGQAVPYMRAHFEEAMRYARRSVSDADVRKYHVRFVLLAFQACAAPSFASAEVPLVRTRQGDHDVRCTSRAALLLLHPFACSLEQPCVYASAFTAFTELCQAQSLDAGAVLCIGRQQAGLFALQAPEP